MATSLNMTEQLLKMGEEAVAGDDRPGAFRILRKLLSMREIPRPVTEQAHALLAQVLIKEGQFRQARRSLAVALAHDPASAHYHFLMGRAHDWDDDGDDTEAIHHYRVAVERAPDEATYQSAYGLLLTYVDNVAQGKSHLQKAVRLKSTDPEIRYNYCVGLLNCGDYDQAEQEVRTMLAAQPNDPAFQQVLEELNRLRKIADTGVPAVTGRCDQVIPWPFPERLGAPGRAPRGTQPDGARLPRLSTRSHLKAAVTKLPASHVRQVAIQFGLASGDRVEECRRRLINALSETKTLARAVGALDDVARDALRYLLEQDGWIGAEALGRRFEPETTDRPWHTCWESGSPLAPLRHWGLVYVGETRNRGRTDVGAVIPLELRQTLAAMLAVD